MYVIFNVSENSFLSTVDLNSKICSYSNKISEARLFDKQVTAEEYSFLYCHGCCYILKVVNSI